MIDIGYLKIFLKLQNYFKYEMKNQYGPMFNDFISP